MSVPNRPPDSSSASAAILEQLNELQALSQKLFLSLGPPQAKPPPIPPISAFLECDAKLSAVLARTYTHQMKQMKIEQLKNDIVGLDTRWRDICLELEQDQSQLEAIIKEGEKRIAAAELATTSSVSYPELLRYASRISTLTSAPLGFDDAISERFEPPFPSDALMRCGHLDTQGSIGPLGDTYPVGQANAEASPQSMEPSRLGPALNSYRQDHRLAQPMQFDLDLDLNPDL